MMKAPTATVEAPKASKKQCLNFKQQPPAAQAPADKLLHRLDRVHQRGPGQWSARCPAHDDRGPSLTVKELADGKLLLHCFGGCSVEDVVGAVGLSVVDLFPARGAHAPGAGASPQRLKLPAYQALEVLVMESTVIAVIGSDMVHSKNINDVDYHRLVKAVGRVNQIVEATK